ncbi:MAG: adenylosuccinate synthetase, partial [Caldilineaceae bacterium]|nr:adenylosuccinate synthetase [Caldilineaceae bacterium]
RMPNGEIITDYMPDTPLLYQAQPVYEEWPGWLTSTEECRSWPDLPSQAQAYITRLRELAGVDIEYISVGPERPQMFSVESGSFHLEMA